MQATLRPVTFRIPEDLYQRLRRAAFERNEAQQAIITAALEKELADVA